LRKNDRIELISIVLMFILLYLLLANVVLGIGMVSPPYFLTECC